jgi:hypothetical protein
MIVAAAVDVILAVITIAAVILIVAVIMVLEALEMDSVVVVEDLAEAGFGF